jgi:uncharacterized protein (DUF433 family)
MLRQKERNTSIPPIATTHILIDGQGAAWVANTTTKVIEIVLDARAYRLTPAQIHAEHPHLSLAQIHAALSYYYDHKDALDADLDRRYKEAERLRSEATGQVTRVQLEARRSHPQPSA